MGGRPHKPATRKQDVNAIDKKNFINNLPVPSAQRERTYVFVDLVRLLIERHGLVHLAHFLANEWPSRVH